MAICYWLLLLVVGTEASEALEANAKSQLWHKQSRYKVVAEWERSDVGKLRSTGWVRQKGNLIDFANEIEELDSTKASANLNERFVNDGEWFYSRTTSSGRRKLTGGRTSKLQNATSKQIEGTYYGFQLDGHFPGNEGKTLCELLAQSKQIVDSKVAIDGIECICLQGDTEYGKIKVCLDPKQGHVLRYGEITKVLGDRYSEERFGEHINTKSLTKWFGSIQVEKVDQVGDYFIPSQGRLVLESDSGNSVKKGEVFQRRSEFDLSPDFSGTDAFVMDFDNGARVSDFDHPESKIGYIWQQGKMVPEGVKGIAERQGKADYSSSALARWRVIGMLAVGVAFMVLILIVSRLRDGRIRK